MFSIKKFMIASQLHKCSIHYVLANQMPKKMCRKVIVSIVPNAENEKRQLEFLHSQLELQWELKENYCRQLKKTNRAHPNPDKNYNVTFSKLNYKMVNGERYIVIAKER